MHICVPFEFDCLNGLNLSLLKISLYSTTSLFRIELSSPTTTVDMNKSPRLTSVRGSYHVIYLTNTLFTYVWPKEFGLEGFKISESSTSTSLPSLYETGLVFLSYKTFDRFFAISSFAFTISTKLNILSLNCNT